MCEYIVFTHRRPVQIFDCHPRQVKLFDVASPANLPGIRHVFPRRPVHQDAKCGPNGMPQQIAQAVAHPRSLAALTAELCARLMRIAIAAVSAKWSLLTLALVRRLPETIRIRTRNKGHVCSWLSTPGCSAETKAADLSNTAEEIGRCCRLPATEERGLKPAPRTFEQHSSEA